MNRMLPLLMWKVIPLLSQENLWRNCRAVPALKRKEKHIRKQISLENMENSPTVKMSDK